MSSPFIPSPVQHTDYPAGGGGAALIIASRNPSNTIDKLIPSGYFWLSDLTLGGSGNLYYNGGFSGGSPAWTLMSSAAGVLNTLSDGITTVTALGGNIALEGTANQITVTASPPSHELIFTIPSAFIAPGSIASTTTLTVGTSATIGTDLTVGDDLVVTDDASIGGDLTVIGTITLGGISVDGTVAINTSGAGTTTIGNAAAGAITIDVGSGDFQVNGGGNEIHIGDDAAANLITIGSLTGAASLLLQAGTGDVLVEGAVTTAYTIGTALGTGNINVGISTAGQDINIGSAINTAAQVIDIANGASAANSDVRILSGTGTAGAAQILLGNNPRVTVASLADVAPAASRTTTVGGGTVVVAAVTDTIDIGPDGATTNANSIKTVNVNTGGVTTGQVLTNIATGAVTSGTHTTAIATGNRAAGTMAVNLLTGTGTKTFNAGNADGLTTFNFIGPSNINASQNSNTAINSGTSTGTVTIGNSLAGAITIDTAAGISIDSATASNFTVTGAANLTLQSTAGRLIVDGGVGANNAVTINALTALGGVDINAGTGGITIDSGAGFSIDGVGASNVTTTGAGIDLTLSSVLGSVLVSSTENAALAIRLYANGGTSETIQIHSDQGTGLGSINLLSDVGGISLTATGLVNADAIRLDAPAGGVHTSSALQTLITSSQAAATAVQITASDAAGGITLTAGTGDVNVSGNLNLSDVATKISMNGGAATDFIGTATLVAGTTGAIANTNIAATDRIMAFHISPGASTELGILTYTIAAGASFTITALDPTDASTATGDISLIGYVIFGQN